jgi:serine-type D-Ala-D-Ala carboxypeptidase/endopeptidase
MFIYDWQKGPMSSFVVIILCIIIIASPTITSVLASPPLPTTNLSIQPISSSALISAQEEKNNSSSIFKITDQIKRLINALVDKNKTNAAIAIGFIDRNGTQFYGHGKISYTNTTTVDQNTIFAIGSITKDLL